MVSPHYAHVAQGVQAQAALEGKLCIVGTTGGDPERKFATVQLMRQEQAECVIRVGNVVNDADYRERMGENDLVAAGARQALRESEPERDWRHWKNITPSAPRATACTLSWRASGGSGRCTPRGR